MPHPRRLEREEEPRPFVEEHVPSNLDYKEQGLTLEEIEARRSNEPPSNIDYKDQALTVEELRQRQQQQQRERQEATGIYEEGDRSLYISSPQVIHASTPAHYAQPMVYKYNSDEFGAGFVPSSTQQTISQPTTNRPTELERDSSSANTGHSHARRKLYLLGVPLLLVLIILVVVVALVVAGSSSESSQAAAVTLEPPTTPAPTAQPTTWAPTMKQNATTTLPPETSDGPPFDSCVGVTVPTLEPLPPFAKTRSCLILEPMIVSRFTQGVIDTDGRNWTGTCSCVNTNTGAVATCRYDSWRCFSLRQLCTLQTDTIEWLNSDDFTGISHVELSLAFQCGRSDVVFYSVDYTADPDTCTTGLNGQDCLSCSIDMAIDDDRTCGQYNCTNLALGGDFDTCTGVYDFYRDSPFYEHFGANFAGEGRVPLRYFPARPGEIPFPADA